MIFSKLGSRVHYSKRRTGIPKRIFKIIAILLLCYAIRILIVTFFFSSIVVAAPSMQPTLQKGDRLVTSSIVYGFSFIDYERILAIQKPKRGDLILINRERKKEGGFKRMGRHLLSLFFLSSIPKKNGSSQYIRRIIALPGDEIEIRDHQAYIFIEGNPVHEQELLSKSYSLELYSDNLSHKPPFSGQHERIRLQDGEFYVMADSRKHGLDSRHWGPISEKNIIQPVIFRYWPPIPPLRLY